MKHRVQEFTGLRAVAVAMVVAGHAQRTLAGGYTGVLAPLRLFSDGRLGVLIFFVLSGFLITTILQAELKSTGAIRLVPFYVKRAVRIWPAFYTYIAVIVVLSSAGWIDVDCHQVAYAALHIWNYSELLGMSADNALHPDGAWYLGHFWTLALEEQFYWLWPLLLFYIWRRNSQRVLVVLIFLVPLIRVGHLFRRAAFARATQHDVSNGHRPDPHRMFCCAQPGQAEHLGPVMARWDARWEAHSHRHHSRAAFSHAGHGVKTRGILARHLRNHVRSGPRRFRGSRSVL